MKKRKMASIGASAIIMGLLTTRLVRRGKPSSQESIGIIGAMDVEVDSLKEAASKTAPHTHVFEGRVCSGDQFITEKEQKDTIVSDFGGMCCEMEGAAIAQACFLNDIPFVIIRAISDKEDGSASVEFESFSAEAAENCAKIGRAHV